MTARDDLFEKLRWEAEYWGADITEAEDAANQLINAFAYELSEYLRASGYGQAGNFIDPNLSAGLVRPDEEPT